MERANDSAADEWADDRRAAYPHHKVWRTRPLLLVGSGLGGYVARVYASRYNGEVVGMLLLDTLWEERTPQSDQSAALIHTVAWAGAAGIVRAKAELTHSGWLQPRPYPPQLWPVVSALSLRTRAFGAAAREWEAQDQSAAEVRSARPAFPDIPLVVLTPGSPRGAEQIRLWTYWRDAHAQIAQTSARGRQVIAGQNNPPFVFTQPELVAHTIRDLLDASG